jgi:Zn-dependent peptidase ImmA (M78 family)
MINRPITFIEDTVTQLYDTADLPRPTSRRCITPLGELVGTFNLTCTEIVQLTQLVAMHYLLERGGIVELPTMDNAEPLAGFLHVDIHYGSIFVEAEDSLVRRRFSVAHELGHYLLHFQPLLSLAESDHEYCEITDALSHSDPLFIDGQVEEQRTASTVIASSPKNQQQLLPPFAQMEREANQFAAELLMPYDVIKGLLARYATYLRGDDLVWRMATEMLVSGESVHWRLHNLGLFSLIEKKVH